MSRLIRVADYLAKMMIASICAFFIRVFNPSMRNIWIVSERGDDARDNGYFFFKYMLKEHPSIPVYYIISKASVDAKKIPIKKRIETNRFNHFKYFALSKVRISSHAWGGDIPFVDYYRKLGLAKIFKKKVVFLQHGITKDYQPGLCYPIISPSIFICGAYPEYDYVLNEFNHPEGVVKYTGFARFDSLHDFKAKNQILIMPTFRKWLQGSEEKAFMQSQYYQKWQEILDDPRIKEIIDDRQLELVFYPHYEVQKYIGLFHTSSKSIKIADFNNYDVQTLLKESKLLVTDFSSVFFDFSYMHKPTIFYQFDRPRYITDHYDFTRGYFDYDSMAPGKVVFDKDALISEIEHILENDFAVDTEYLDRIKQFFPLSDQKNCDRIYESISNGN